MSFGRELKDFAAGFQTVKSAQHQKVQDDYYRALTDKAKKGPPSQSDPDGVMDGAIGNENIDTAKPHGFLYNMGKWLGLDGQGTAAPTAAGPMQTVARAQALPLDAYDSSQDTPLDNNIDGYAKGGLVRGRLKAESDPDVYDDGGPDAGTGALPTEAVTTSARRNPTGYLQAAHNPGAYNDGGPEAGPKVVAPNPTEAVTVTATREPPRPTPRPTPDNDGGPEVTDPYAEKIQTAELGPVNTGPAEEDGGAAPQDTPQDSGSAIPVARDVQAPTDAAVASADNMGDLSAALHSGIMNLQAQFKLHPDAGAVPDHSAVAAGQQKLFASEGRASHEDMQAVAKAVDPNGELTHSQMLLRAMTKGYEHYMTKGDPQRAANFAAMIIQYSTFEASKHGADAMEALKKGDINSAAKSLKAGYDNIPDGKEATDVRVNPDKTISVTETDVKTGKPVQQHTLSPQEMYGAALGLKNKTLSWQALMGAAGSAKGYNAPESEAYTNAQLKLAGAGADGTLTDAGNPPPAQAIPASGQPPAQTQQPQGDQIVPNPGEKAPMGIRTNNPGNMRPGGQQANYETPTAGVLAASANLDSYAKRGINTIAGIIGHWAPPNENNTTNYTQFVAKRLGVDPNAPLNMADPNVKGKLLEAIFQMENGRQPQLNGAPTPQAQPMAGAAPRPDPKNPLALQAPLPEDVPEAPNLPPEPTMGALPERPVPPKQDSLANYDTANMAPKERITLQKEIAAKNIAARNEFNEKMRLWTSQASEARTNFNAEHTKYADAMRANKKGVQKDPFALPVKDRTDALTALQQARPDPKNADDPTGKLFGSLQPPSQKAVDNVAYGLFTHNDTTPARAYQAAVSMMMPQSVNFTPHTMPNGNVRVVFRTGDKMVMPKNVFDELAAARGNEHYIMRTGRDKIAADGAKDKALWAKGGKAAAGLGKAVAGAGDLPIPDVGGTVARGAINAIDGVGKLLYDPKAKPEAGAVTVPTI